MVIRPGKRMKLEEILCEKGVKYGKITEVENRYPREQIVKKNLEAMPTIHSI